LIISLLNLHDDLLTIQFCKKITLMTQRSVAVKGQVIPFVLWQRSSLAPFRIHNQSASSRNHHRTYVVTRRVFVRSPLWCFHRKVRVIASRGRYKGSRRVTHAGWDKSRRRYRLLASHIHIAILRNSYSLDFCLIPSRGAVRIRDHIHTRWRQSESVAMSPGARMHSIDTAIC